MIYSIEQNYDFKIINTSEPTSDFFLLRAEDGNGNPVDIKLAKLPFQRRDTYRIPDTLTCRVKSLDDDGVPVLSHIIAPYVYDLYKDAFKKKQSIECEVVAVPLDSTKEPVILRDRNGIFYRLKNGSSDLVKGQRVRCRFEHLSMRSFSLNIVDEGAKLPFYSPSQVFDAIGVPGALRAWLRFKIIPLAPMEPVRREISQQQPRWILTACNVILSHLSEWFLSADIARHGASYRLMIDYMRQIVLYLLEGSHFMDSLPRDERRVLQGRLTNAVEALQPYDRMVELVLSGTQDLFVEQLFDKLTKSGYLYHPAKQFSILMLIFRLHPDKVGYYLSRIFESIFSRDFDNWNREPFRSAFVEQFRIYVSQARGEIDLCPLAENRQQKTKIETIIIAMALELLLSDSDEDKSHTYSLFFRYISLLRPLYKEALLSKSVLSLLGVEPFIRLDYNQLKEPMMMMTNATILPDGDAMSLIKIKHHYQNGGIDICISSDGIAIREVGAIPVEERVIPDGLMTWLKPQIFVQNIPGLSGSRLRKINDHQTWWQDIENALFHKSTIETEEIKIRRRADVGDEVYIVVDHIDDFFSSNPTFVCHIEDTDYQDGVGILKRDMIVGYNLKQPSETVFRDKDGHQYGFLATITATLPDGSYVFSLRNEVDRLLENLISFDSEYLAVITGINERDYSAISRDGFGLFVEKDSDRRLTIGDIVKCRISKGGKQGSIRAYATEVSNNPEDKFDKATAFANIMSHLRFEQPNESSNEEVDDEISGDIDDILLPDDIREIAEAIHFRAIADSDMLRAYDYLRFARILALAISDSILANRLATHAALLSQHQYFAKNNRVDNEKLESLRDVCSDDPLLSTIFKRLEMVSWMGHNEHNSDLFACTLNPSGDLEANIASMVLSYNLVNTVGGEDNSVAAGIRTSIMEKLNVNNETKQGKYYGSESKYLEFKTSLVYLPGAPGEEMQEKPSEQQRNILSRIAGMLNATGGRLYLGVNNDGYEVGMHDDFKYYERHKMTIGNYQFRINNVDNLCVFLENLVNETFGSTIARKINIEADSEASKEVVLITIEESLDPVYLDGRLFVRQSGQSTREYHDKDIANFVSERAQIKAQRAIVSADTIESTIAPAIDNTTKNQEDTHIEVVSQKETPRLFTSQWRPNVLHHWENGYVEPQAYIYFFDNGKILYSTNDLYYETGVDGCSLALVVPHELKNGYIVLGFKNEKVNKVPLSEIFEKSENTLMEYFHDDIMFASLAAKDDAIICVVADSGGSLWRRGIVLSQVENSHIGSLPKRIHETVTDHTVMWEISDSSAVEALADCMAHNIATRRIGVTLRVKENTPATAEKLQQFVEKCKPM